MIPADITQQNSGFRLQTKTGIVVKVLPKEPGKDAVRQIMKILEEEKLA